MRKNSNCHVISFNLFNTLLIVFPSFIFNTIGDTYGLWFKMALIHIFRTNTGSAVRFKTEQKSITFEKLLPTPTINEPWC